MSSLQLVTFITSPCMVCRKSTSLSLRLDDLARWKSGELVQNVWPEKAASERELIVTGTHPECWDAMFKEGDN